MSNMELAHAIDRIRMASDGQEIAVFTTGQTGVFRCVFARTVATQQEIEEGHPSFIGVFSAMDDIEDVRKQLRAAERRQQVSA